MSIGDQIKFNRGIKHLTQVQFSELVDVGRDTLISYEKGRTLPPVKTLIKLSEVL
ncbi:MAG: helix-turn-helix transcriptional regulator [Candidatus Marinimicrobia bacterium]|nr:helix-turn-helix transcriptional regulator [Candidatus Neomarinimicrobiota bacterium]